MHHLDIVATSTSIFSDNHFAVLPSLVKQGLTIDEIKMVKNFTVNSKCEFARDMFLFSIYAQGMAFIDMAYLLKSNVSNGILSYKKRNKGETIYIKWEKCMQEIVDKYHVAGSSYLLHIIKNIVDKSNNHNHYKCELNKVNNKLKKISHEIGLTTPLTMNIASSSWLLAANTVTINTNSVIIKNL